MDYIKRWFYYRYLRANVKRKWWLDKQSKLKLTENQLYGIEIFQNAICHKDAILLVDRQMEISYIHIPLLKVFMKLERKELTISNTVYDRFIQIPENEYVKLINKYDRKLSRVRHKWETTITEKSTDNLKKLLTAIKTNVNE